MPPRFCPDCDDLLRDAERPRDADYVICLGCRAKVYDDGAVSRPKKKKTTAGRGRGRGRSSSRGWMFAVGGLALGFVLLVVALILVGRSRRSDLSPVALRDARAGFTTKLIPNEYEADGPAPPPEAGLRLVKYRSPAGDLAA